MSNRKRFVYPSDRIAHLWMHAHESQGQARNAGNNFYFVGDTIYSYGSHFPIARHIDGGILLTTRTYSVTTSRHISAVRQAIRHCVNVFHVANPLANLDECAAEFRASVVEAREELASAKNKAQRVKRWSALRSAIADANAFNKFAKRRERYKLPANAEALDAEAREYDFALAARRTVQDAKRRERWEAQSAVWKAKREEAQRVALLDAEEKIKLWRAGTIGNSYLPWSLPTMLRIVGDNVETSKGADFPLAHAKRAAEYLAPKLASGETFTTNGKVIRLGHFTIDALDAEGTIRAGCHTIKREELEHFLSLI